MASWNPQDPAPNSGSSRVISRGYSGVAQAVSNNNAARNPSQWSVDTLRNGAIRLAVAPVEPRNGNYSGGPPQALLYIPAGARHERYNLGEQGMSHVLRRSIGLSTTGASGFAIVRSLQQMGATFECSSSRENLVYSLSVPQERWFSEALKYADLTATQCNFYQWELSRLTYKHMHTDQMLYKRRQFDLMLTELLHQAAFRGHDLAHSLVAPEHALLHYKEPSDPEHPSVEPPHYMQECYSEQSIEGFVQRQITQQPITLVVTGITAPFVKELREKIDSGALFATQTSGGQTTASKEAVKFVPSDQRYEMPLLGRGLVALGWPIPGMGQHKQQAAIGVLLRSLTGGTNTVPRIHFGAMPQSILWDALQSEPNLPPVAVGCLHWTYSDTGLFGVQLTGFNEKGSLGTALKVVARQLKRVAQQGIKEQQLAVAKTNYRMDLLLGLETSNATAEHVGEELALTGAVTGEEKLLQEIDNVSLDDVNKAASQIFGRLPAIAAVGDIHGVPYADELSRS